MKRLDSKRQRQYRVDKQRGVSVIEVLVVIAIVTILLAFGFVGVTRARSSMRLSGAAREYAAYIEKARVDSIRRHADNLAEAASVAINDDRTSYVVTLDVDGDGTMETRNIPLPVGVSFQTVETIAFDWRGRTWNTVGGVTTSHAQVSITLSNGTSSVSADVTGSGDVTIDSRAFDDSVPNVSVNVGDLNSSASPSPTPSAVPTPSVSPSPGASPSPTPSASPISTPTPTATPTPTPTPTPTATPTPTPTPTATPTPAPTPTPAALCVLTSSPTAVLLAQDGTTNVVINHTSLSSVTVSAASSKSSDLQVTASGSQTAVVGGSVTFTLKAKKSPGAYTATFTSSCGQVIVPVTIY